MKSNPYIVLTFLDNNQEVIITDDYIMEDSMKFDYKLLNDLKPSSNMVSFTITKDFPELERLINTKSDIKIQIYKWNYVAGPKTILFTGYVSNKYEWSVNDHGESVLKITCEDVGTKLLKKIYNKDNEEVLKGTMTEVLDTLCKSAGVTRADDVVVSTKVLLSAKKNSKFEDLLKKLVRECLYTYYFNEEGKLVLKSFPSIEDTASKTDYIVNQNNLFKKSGNAITLRKSIQQYGKSEVKFTALEEMKNVDIYRDESGRDDDHLNCNIKIPANGTYPDKEGEKANVEITDLSTGRDIVYFDPSSIKAFVEGNVKYSIEPHGSKALSVLITNPNNYDVYVTQLKATGNIIVEASTEFARSGSEGDLKETKAECLHNKESASAYAKYLANYYKHCSQEYKFYTNTDMQLGDICRLEDNTFSGLNVRVLLTAKSYLLNGLCEYTAIGISAFDITDVETDGIINPSINPGRPGVGVVGVDYFYAVHDSNINPPANWVPSKPPEFTLEKRYLWSYFVTRYSNGRSEASTPGVVGVLGVDGDAPVVVNPDFNTFAFSADGNGIIAPSELQKMNCVVRVSQDNVDLKAVTGTALNRMEYYLTLETTGITNVVVNGSTVSCTENSIITGDSASIKVIVTYKNDKGKEGKSVFIINLTVVTAGKAGSFTAFEYALSTSSSIAPDSGWSNVFPENIPDDNYLWFRQQFVESGSVINPDGWSTPRLGDGNVTKVYKDLDVISEQIAFSITPDGKIHPNSPEGASLVIGSVEGDGYIRMDAKNIIAKGTITADKINTTSLGATNLKLNNGGSIYSGGFNEDGTNPTDADGFYIDSEGHLDAVSATLNNAHVEGVLDCRDDKGIVLFTEKGSNPKVVNCTSPSRWSLMDFFNHMPVNKDIGVDLDFQNQYCRKVEGMDFLVKTFNIYSKGQTASYTAPCDMTVRLYLPGDDQGYAGGRNYVASWGSQRVDDSYHERSYVIDLIRGQVINIRVAFGNIGAPAKPVSISIIDNSFYYFSSISGSGTNLTYNITYKETAREGFFTTEHHRSIKGIWNSSDNIKYTTVKGWADGIGYNQLYQTDSTVPVYINDQIMYTTSVSKSNDYFSMSLAGQPKYNFLLNPSMEEGTSTGWYNIRGNYQIVDKQRGITTDTLLPYIPNNDNGVSDKSLGSATKKYKSIFVENVFADNITGIDIPGMFGGSFSQGWFTLPNKVMIQWGKYMGPEQHDHNEVIPFKTNFASGYQPMVFLTAPVPDRYQGENTDDIISITPSNFTLRMSRWKQNVTWIAIGQAP